MSRLPARLTRAPYPGCDAPLVVALVSVSAVFCAVVAAILLLAPTATENFLGYSLLVLAAMLLVERYFNRLLKRSSRELALSAAARARANIDLSYAEARLAEWCVDSETARARPRPA